MKRLIHVYKAGAQWRQSPPGLGDFVRGTCHLFERLQGTGAELRLDLSQTEFSGLIEPDPTAFHQGDAAKIAAAEEWFVQPERVESRLAEFLQSPANELYLCTNLGAWDRLTLNAETCAFAKKFYRFGDAVQRAAPPCATGGHVVLSVRCGDKFYGETAIGTDPAVSDRLFRLVEKEILPELRGRPLVVMSDCFPLKQELARRYGFHSSGQAAQHGAFGNVLPVAIDLHVLKTSQTNYHINAWQSWWSGFSHYTSLVFGLPSINFRTPHFVREEVTPTGELRLPWRVRARQKLRETRSFLRHPFRRQAS